MKEYSKGIYVKFKLEEVEMIHDRMKEAGVRNMSAYIRKMALNGYMIIPEWPDLKRMLSLHSRINNNLNQYSHMNLPNSLEHEYTLFSQYAAFERCADVITFLILKYGSVLKRKCHEHKEQ